MRLNADERFRASAATLAEALIEPIQVLLPEEPAPAVVEGEVDFVPVYPTDEIDDEVLPGP